MRLPFNGNYGINQRFGENPASYARFGIKGHNGIDYNLPTGTPVIAAISGNSRILSDPGGFGNYVIVSDGTTETWYAHLTFGTAAGRVTEGQEIGKSGNTGNSTGPHLHFAVRPVRHNPNNGYNGFVDPQSYLNGGDDMAWKEAAEKAQALATQREKERDEWKATAEKLQPLATQFQKERDNWKAAAEKAQAVATKLQNDINTDASGKKLSEIKKIIGG